MKIFFKIAVVTAAVFLAGAQDMDAQARLFNPDGGKNKLKEENAQLKARLDSLEYELERYRAELQAADSIAGELMEVYGLQEEIDSTVLTPEMYTAEISDSLLNIWYAHRMASDVEVEYDMETVKFESNVPDSVYIERLKKMNSFISLPYNDIVRSNIILYSEKMSKNIPHILGLCNYYMPIFDEIFNKYDLPEELKAMAVIESAMNPLATSRAGAKGMWQFMYSTAKMYGLHIDSFVDERLDPIKSAEAAAQYLMDSYQIFGDWNLAIASYNCGAGNVNRAIHRSGGSRAFWDIWPYLPRETRGYVPAFVGALYTMTYYKEHGIKPETIEMPVAVDTFRINRQLHLRQVSDLTGAPIEELKNLNPQYRHEIIPGNSREYILRLPYTYTNAFIDQEDSLYKHKLDVYFNPVTIKKIQDGGDGERITYRVKSGDYLGKIAANYRCTVAQIKRWNNLSSNNIRVGQRLVIYRGGNAPASASTPAASSSSSKKSSSPSTSGSSTYTVKNGDTLSEIALKHGTTVAKLKEWNALSGNKIRVGQKLNVKAPAASAPKTTPSASGDYVTYTVREGDSFYTIAKDYPGISAQNIMDYNGIDSAKIKPGMKIKIPTKL